jgi:transposase
VEFGKAIAKAQEEASQRKKPLRIMFKDEARFGRMNEVKSCWSPKGRRPEVIKQMVREYTYAYGAVSPSDGRADFLILPGMTGDLMGIFLKEIGQRYPEEYIVMFMDGAACHKSTETPENIKIEYLPPYCPQLNPVENIWDEIKEKNFTNKAFDSMDAVEDQLEAACRKLEENNTKVMSITSLPWIIVHP